MYGEQIKWHKILGSNSHELKVIPYMKRDSNRYLSDSGDLKNSECTIWSWGIKEFLAFPQYKQVSWMVLKKKPGKASFVNEEDASVCHICHAKIVWCSKYL